MPPHNLRAVPKPALPLRGRTSFPVPFPTDINEYTQRECLYPCVGGGYWIGWGTEKAQGGRRASESGRWWSWKEFGDFYVAEC
jgi:hypothetical protein